MLAWLKREWQFQAAVYEYKALPAVRVLGIDQTRGPARHRPGRSGRAGWVVHPEQALPRRWSTTGCRAGPGLARSPTWSMVISTIYARPDRLALPDANVMVDRFHPVALANRAVTEHRRGLAWARRDQQQPNQRLEPDCQTSPFETETPAIPEEPADLPDEDARCLV